MSSRPSADARRRRTEAPETRRRQLLDAAKERVRTVGFHATTMAEIAARAGVSVGLIYQHFPSKEALIEAIVLEDVEGQADMFERVLARQPEDLRQMIGFALEELEAVLLDRDRAALMLEVAAEAARNAKVREAAAAAGVRFAPLLERIAALAPAGWTTEQTFGRFKMVSALMQGLVIQALVGDAALDRPTLDLLREEAMRLFTPDAQA